VTLEPGSLVVKTNGHSYVVSARAGVATIGRDPHAQVKIDDARISRVHVRIEFVEGTWRAVDTSMNGMFLGSSRAHTVTITDGLVVRLGDMVAGPAVEFELVPTDGPADADDRTALVEPDEESTVALHPGMVRAGAAAAARRRELDISQRSLAADGIINAGALISFEKGRSWPRDRTRAKLEEVLQWAPGTIAKLRAGAAETPPTQPSMPLAAADEAPLIAQAVEAAVNALGVTIDALPPMDDPGFTPRVTAILTDLRQLEQVAVSATRIGRITPALLKSLSLVRRELDELTMLAATAPTASLGQRVYAARRRANLTIAETAQAAGVPDDVIAHAESEQPIPAEAAPLIEALVAQLD
jgi:transcriptional regulator with XRE-family HTH domain/DNA-binding XRE family transcriptional regulator